MQHKIKSLFIICLVASMSFLASCSKDDDGPAGSPIVGTWTFNAASVNFTVNNSSLRDFLASTDDFTGPEAAAAEAFLKELFIGEGLGLSGTSATFNQDGTYTFSGSGFTETGTYALQNNNTRLSLTSDGETEVVNVLELTNNRLKLGFEEEDDEIMDDLFGFDENMKIAFDITFVK